MSLPRRPCPAKSETVMCDCPMTSPCVLEEFRELAKPGGAKRALQLYGKEIRIRQAQLARRHGEAA